MSTQPNDETCGPTSLHSIYNYFGDKITLEETISTVRYLKGGGTLDVLLGIHALERGYKATVYTYNMVLFDPSWFVSGVDIKTKLKEQLKYKTKKRIVEATPFYIEFLEKGGVLKHQNLTNRLLRKYLDSDVPILTGVSSTYLYQTTREYTTDDDRVLANDLRGYPVGHFVVLAGYDEDEEHIIVADPYSNNPISGDNYYGVGVSRLINSILLGIVTFDADLLIIEPIHDPSIKLEG